AHDVDEGQVGYRGAVGETTPLQVGEPTPGYALSELVQQTRLAHARLGDNSDHLSVSPLCLREEIVEVGHLARAADELSQLAIAECLAGRASGADSDNAVGGDQLALTLQVELTDRLDPSEAADK